MSLCGQAPKAHSLAKPTFPISLTLLSLASITILLRFYSRYHARIALWWDDLCDVFALAFCIAFVATNIHMIKITHGYDMWFVNFDVINEFLVVRSSINQDLI
ncbi:hypothetical protein HJFPF1_13488 [Paramyrothecium foliicola]|nr:hypothetical protein HJFPF1_13488 [Paramyrothecium foliicola]